MPIYFAPELFQFLNRLKRNNNRDWFLAHWEEYEACILRPALRFITDLPFPCRKSPLTSSPIPACHAVLCSASIATRVSPMTSALTRRTWPCAFPTKERMFTHPASIFISNLVAVSLRPAFGTQSLRLYSSCEAPSCRGRRNGVPSANSSAGTTPASSAAPRAAFPRITNSWKTSSFVISGLRSISLTTKFAAPSSCQSSQPPAARCPPSPHSSVARSG